MSQVFVGIDPGQTGGLGILDVEGGFLGAWRWNAKNPLYLYNKLLLFRELIGVVYLELIQTFPQKEKGFIVKNQSTLVNYGIWQGWLMAAGIRYVVVSPLTWQALQGLHHWAKKREKDPRQHSPLTLARSKWPAAPLEFQADDGKAVALLLAALAHEDERKGFDRAALQEANAAKRKTKKQKERQLKKAFKDLPWKIPENPF